MDPHIENFLKYEYAEAKDLAKSFLTLVAAVLVFSITFSERIVGFQTAGRSSRALLVASWVLIFGAIVTCGLAIVFFYSSNVTAVECGPGPCGGMAAGMSMEDIFVQYTIGNFLMAGAGGFFVLGLLSLTASALASVVARPLSNRGEGSTLDPQIERLVLDVVAETQAREASAENDVRPPVAPHKS